MWLLFPLLLLIVVAALAVLLSRARRNTADQPRRRCVSCQGTGWVGGGPQRTLTFDGEGFTDRQERRSMCERCGGSGVGPG